MSFKEEDHDFCLNVTVKDKNDATVRKGVVESRSLSWMEQTVMTLQDQQKQIKSSFNGRFPENHDYNLTITVTSKESGTIFLEEVVIERISLRWIEVALECLQGK